MSIHWMSAVWKRGPINPTDRYVLLKLADNADHDGKSFPYVDEICDATQFKESAVRKSLARLKSDSWIRSTPGGRHLPATYHLSREKLFPDEIRPVSGRPLPKTAKSRPVPKTPLKDSRPVRGRPLPSRPLPSRPVPETFRPVRGTKPPHPHKGVTINNRINPPNPLLHAGGNGNTPLPTAAQHDHAEAALAHVAEELGITGSPRTVKKLLEPLRWYKRQQDITAYQAADAMIAAWRTYQREAPLRGIAKPWTIATFFTQGHWINQHSWPIDPKLRGSVH